jgi:integrase
VALVDRFRDELHEQAATTRAAAARGRPMIETVTDRRGLTYQRRRRALSNTSINAMLKLLGQILQQAVNYDLVSRNPARVGERGQRFLPRVKPPRTFLEIDQFHALLEAAGQLDGRAFSDTRGLVYQRKRDGQTVAEIARALNLTSQSVCYHLGRPAPQQLAGRRAIIAALGLEGFRIGELRELRGGHVDLARARCKSRTPRPRRGSVRSR